MESSRLAIGLAALGLVGAASSDAPPPAITDLHAITLHGGTNQVPGFLPGGGAATIIEAWVGNGNAHGHFTWMVLGGPSEDQPVGLVVFRHGTDDPGTGETISASPFDGERVTGNVRFATARIDGKPVSLAIKAVLEWPPSGVIADHATATLRWYKFVPHTDDGDRPLDTFEIVGTTHTTRRYCNVDLALRDVAAVPLPRDFAGANRIDGCFPPSK